MSGKVAIFDRINGFLVIFDDSSITKDIDILIGDVTGLKKDGCYCDIYRRKGFIGTIYGDVEIREDWYGNAGRRAKK